MSSIPDKPTLDGLEAKWRAIWSERGTYTFDRSRTRDEVYSIDTPPPTVSGSLHIGHVMSFTHTDTVARYQRMRGKEVFYPMGWDDNGLNVERRVQMLTATLCDPSLPYDPDFTAPQPDEKGRLPKDPVRISRPNFVELCETVVEEMEAEYHELWSVVGLSVDWDQTYTTIGPIATRISQKGFLRLLADGTAYRSGAPTLWDVDMKTAVAQAELEDREIPGAYHKLLFTGPDGTDLAIDTTRPELLPACVALVAHPDDERYQPLFGQTATTPLFGARVPICAHELAQPDKGTGIAMICTFGDTTDVIWWRELDLPIRPVIRHDGRLERDLTWTDDPDDAVGLGRPRRGQRQLRRARRQDRLQRPEDHRRAAHGQGEDGRRAPSHHPPGQVLGERQEATRDRQLEPVVHPLPTRLGDHRTGQGTRVPPRVHAGAVRGLGQRAAG